MLAFQTPNLIIQSTLENGNSEIVKSLPPKMSEHAHVQLLNIYLCDWMSRIFIQ